MRRLLLSALFLMGAAMAPAEILYPQGTGMPAIDQKDPTGMFPNFDTLYVEASSRFFYGKAGMDLGEFLAMQNSYASVWEIDTAGASAVVNDQGVLVRRDSSGLTAGIDGHYTYSTGGTSTARIRYGYSPEGKRILDVHEFVLGSQGDTAYNRDTVHWVWTHPGCADAYRGKERWVWQVDAEGHCSRGIHSGSWSGTWEVQDTIGLVWENGKVVKAWSKLGMDTLEQERWEWSADGRLLSLTSQERDTAKGVWKETFEYAGDVLVGATVARGGSQAQMVYDGRLTTLRPANLGLRTGIARSAPVTVRREAAALRFANAGSEAVEIQVSTARGEQVGRLRVEAGREASLPVNGTSAMLVWSAKGRSAGAHGTVLPGR